MQKRFRDGSSRLKNWDYGSNGSYFITACALNHECYFGNIPEEQLEYSDSGIIVESLWKEIPKRFPYAKIDAFVVMPNHIHGIVTIDKPTNSYIDFTASKIIDDLSSIQMLESFKRQDSGGFSKMKNPMINENISRIVRWFKGRCSFEIRKQNKDFEWQPRFYDHIIRTKESYGRIERYIKNNPSNWKRDKMFHK